MAKGVFEALNPPVHVNAATTVHMPPAPPPANGKPTVASLSAELAAYLEAPVPAEVHRIGTLYVGCRPRGVSDTDVVDLDLIIAKAKIAIGAAAYYQAYGYKANGMLLQMVEGIILHEKPLAVVIAHPTAYESTLCLSTLLGMSDTVVEACAR